MIAPAAPQEFTIAIGDLPLDDGSCMRTVEQRVTVYGNNAGHTVLICHALTGSSRVADWWSGIVRPGGVFDPSRSRIVCINALGSCFGSTGPSTRDAFPRITIADIVRAQARAVDRLGIHRLDVVVGGSFGGMQALQWAVAESDRVVAATIVAAHDHHSAMGIALNALQREALTLDPDRGLRLARKIAMLSYKSDELLGRRHDRRRDRHGRAAFDVETYLEYQAERFTGRMDAPSYGALTHAMDSFDVRECRTPGGSRPEVTFVGISSDWLFRAQAVHSAAARFAERGFPTRYAELRSHHGHDAFLSEQCALAEVLRSSIDFVQPDALGAKTKIGMNGEGVAPASPHS